MSTGLSLNRLRCEYFENPLGITEREPRFSWELVTDEPGTVQASYRVVCTDASGAVAWDSGTVASDRSAHVVYAGRPLVSRDHITWSVTVIDNHGQTATAEAWFELALLAPDDWSAEFISGPLVGGNQTMMPPAVFRKEFEAPARIAHARLYVTALGLYEVEVNGTSVGDAYFRPGWTDYAKRLQFDTYDVTELVRAGANGLGATVADGWYSGFVGMWPRQGWGDRPAFLAQLEIVDTEGNVHRVTTDGTWRTTVGPILEADFLHGQAVDARREMPGWSSAGFDDSSWWPVEMPSIPAVKRVASPGPVVRCTQELRPINDPQASSSWQGGRWVYDLGQNMVGVVRLTVKGQAGVTVKLRHAEILDEKGNPYYTNLRSARATDVYTLKGSPEGETFEPQFTFHGFRYVEITAEAADLQIVDVVGRVLHSDTPWTGTFRCNDPLINQLQQNIQWGQRGNFVDVPTDCPQRDERLGWTGDAQVFIRTATHNMDVAAFFAKWFDDIDDAQSDEGAIPAVIPNKDIVGSDGGPAWADAAVICPWTIYRVYGDTRAIDRHYPMMKGFVDYLERTRKDGIRAYDGCGWQGFGDWLSINAHTPNDLIGTAFLAYSSGLLAQSAEVLGKAEDAAHYHALAEETKVAFQARFMTPRGIVHPSSQTANILALHFDLVPVEHRATVVQALVDDIGRRGWKLSAGFVGSPYLPHVLSDGGRLDVAYRLLHQKEWPSWLYAVTQGATTIWERWDGWTHDKGFQDPGMNSFNHYAYGAVGEWLYAKVAGIDLDPTVPGFRKIVMKPLPGGGIHEAEATLHSMQGPIRSAWNLVDGVFTWTVTIPPNSTATLLVPSADGSVQGATVARVEDGRAVVELGSGTTTLVAKA